MCLFCRISNDGIAYRYAMFSASRYLDRCLEAAIHFANVDVAISMCRFDHAASDDVLQLAAF